MGLWAAPWPRRVYFLGIGGVAMAGLARLLASRGVEVSGSDAGLYPPASTLLAEAGIDAKTPYRAENIDLRAEMIVVGNAISRGNPELERALDEGLPLVSMPELIEHLLVPGRRVSAVAGTHGKTTTASILAWLHHACGRRPSFVIGGRPGNFETGAWIGEGEDLILEADEYDTAFFDKGPKFLHYWPRIAVLSAVEFDHADIYPDLAAIERAFALLLRLLPAGGCLVAAGEDPRVVQLARSAACPVRWFGGGGEWDLGFGERWDDATGQGFELLRHGRRLGRVRLALPGRHNALNVLAALLAVEAAGVDLLEAAAHLEGFRPPRRRLQLLGRRDGAAVYDDFAHHPTAVAQTIGALRGMVEGGRVVVCLEPRSNTMVRRIVERPLAEALSGADVVWIAAVDRPERFSPDQRLDVEALVRTLRKGGLEAEGPLTPEAIADRVLGDLRPGDRVVLMSNGSFGGLARRLAEALAR